MLPLTLVLWFLLSAVGFTSDIIAIFSTESRNYILLELCWLHKSFSRKIFPAPLEVRGLRTLQRHVNVFGELVEFSQHLWVLPVQEGAVAM